MKPNNSLKFALAAGLSLGVLSPAFAAGTTAGTSIANTASVDYVVGGVNQTDVPSNTTTFVVDRKIDLVVAEVGGAVTNVVPGSSAQVTTFTVTNTSNSVIDVRLVAANKTGDNFDMTGLAAYVESGATGGYQPLEDTAVFIDELAVSAVRTVYIVGSVPAGATNGQNADVTLTGIAAQSTNGTTGAYVATVSTLAADAAETNTAVVDNATFIDTVFADAAGNIDAVTDGQHSDDDRYTLVTATISVNKSSSVVTDPFNCTTAGTPGSCTTPPKAVPGAVVEYCLDVNNTGAAAADTIILTDAIPTNTTYVAGSIKTGATGTGAACTVGSGTALTDIADADAAEFVVTGNGSVTIRSATIAATSRFKAIFRVTVN